ncbi:hypothetical protein SteCoe_36207 [Stentor coeruleus]|uniref:Uncharacterized protein n=1 Tax=Stentor coeruleus TaxID=5963 RepID=A0A1R2AQL3_9CILI|nr:hypothetical protein SteCoe_36207 [Stentor coeruleus]
MSSSGFNLEECAQKIQAAYRGYLIRKHFLAVRLRFERIVKNIEGNTEVIWKSHYLCKPIFQNPQILARLKEIDLRKLALTRELENVEKAIHERKQILRNNN